MSRCRFSPCLIVEMILNTNDFSCTTTLCILRTSELMACSAAFAFCMACFTHTSHKVQNLCQNRNLQCFLYPRTHRAVMTWLLQSHLRCQFLTLKRIILRQFHLLAHQIHLTGELTKTASWSWKKFNCNHPIYTSFSKVWTYFENIINHLWVKHWSSLHPTTRSRGSNHININSHTLNPVQFEFHFAKLNRSHLFIQPHDCGDNGFLISNGKFPTLTPNLHNLHSQIRGEFSCQTFTSKMSEIQIEKT